jgi:hypothetical protein
MGGVRAVVLGVAHSHTGRDGSDAMKEAREILLQRGTTPRVYRNTLVFLAPETRQIDSLKDAVRATLAWEGIVKETKRLNLTQSDSALAEAKLKEAKDTTKTRMRECWCYLIYPVQETAQSEITWISGKVPAQDGLLSRASKRLVSEEGLWPELGPTRLDGFLSKYIWNGKAHLPLKDLWEYLNRYTYLPRVKDKQVLVKAVQSAVANMLPGPFAYAEKWDEAAQQYRGLIIDKNQAAHIVIDADSVIVKPDIAEKHRPAPPTQPTPGPTGSGPKSPGPNPQPPQNPPPPSGDPSPTRFIGTVMISPDRPAREIHQVVESIIEQLTTLSGCEVAIKLEIDAEHAAGFDRAKVRTITENANTLGFIDKKFS